MKSTKVASLFESALLGEQEYQLHGSFGSVTLVQSLDALPDSIGADLVLCGNLLDRAPIGQLAQYLMCADPFAGAHSLTLPWPPPAKIALASL